MTDTLIRLGKDIHLELSRLIETRAGIAANSGAGKSWVLRLLAEQTAPRVPTIILDREGEFSTLRETCDMVLVGRGGEVDTATATAAKLARKLAELRLSAVVDLYDLPKQERPEFVKRFIESLLSLPRKLWGPMLVIVDEAQDFAPGSGRDAVSTPAMVDLACQGRKRGIGSVYATQRISKISKNVMGEANNLLIGRFAQDIDLRRASDLLGFSGRAEWTTMRDGKPGEFFAVGPAFEHTGVKRFKANAVKTTHARAGQRYTVEPPKPSRKILQVAPELADMKREVEAEASELEQLRAENKRLRSSKPMVAAPSSNGVAKIDERAIASARAAGYAEGMSALATVVTATFDNIDAELASIAAGLKALDTGTSSLRTAIRYGRKACGKTKGSAPAATLRTSPTAIRPVSAPRSTTPGSADPRVGSGGMQRILMVLAQHPDGLEPNAIGLFAKMSAKSGTFSTYMGRLRTNGWVEKTGSTFVATDSGVEALGGVDPLPTGDDLRQYWLEWSGDGGQRRLLAAVLDAGDDGIAKDEAASAAELAGNSGTFSTYLGRLRTANLVESFKKNGATHLRATEILR